LCRKGGEGKRGGSSIWKLLRFKVTPKTCDLTGFGYSGGERHKGKRGGWGRIYGLHAGRQARAVSKKLMKVFRTQSSGFKTVNPTGKLGKGDAQKSQYKFGPRKKVQGVKINSLAWSTDTLTRGR